MVRAAIAWARCCQLLWPNRATDGTYVEAAPPENRRTAVTTSYHRRDIILVALRTRRYAPIFPVPLCGVRGAGTRTAAVRNSARNVPRCSSAAAPNCGAQLSPTAKFCPECAHPTSDEVRQLRFTSPEIYTPKYLAEKILSSKTALEGERKHITVFFADLKGSMELLADRDPEEARKLLDAVVERMMEAVHHYEGTVNEVRGDGIMALFGAPLMHEDHALRACYAALRMQEAVKRYADEVRRSDSVCAQIRVGLNSGEVVVRSIGSDLRMDYSAVGRTTHLAARMEQLAAPGTIQLTAATLRLVEGLVEANPLGPMPVKGLSEPVEVFELMGAGAARTRFQAAARRGLSRFVGRSAELEQLRDALDQVSQGRGQVVAVVGDPGVGKSRLFWEFSHSHRLQGWLVIESASVSYGKATSYLPVIDLLKRYFKIQGRDELHEIREKVTGKLLTLDETLNPVLPALLALLDVSVDDAHWNALDPRQRRHHTLDAVKQLLLREAQEQPLLLIFEDLHWIDGETQALLDNLVESLPAARVLLLVNFRPEYSHSWGRKTYYRQLRIDPLPSEGAEELLDALLGPDADVGPLKRLLIERTEANPLFLEESVRALAETGALTGKTGAYRLTRSIAELKMPATVEAILAARIDRLAPEGKRLLQAASVIGKDVPLQLLLAIADVPEHEVRDELTHLQGSEFLYEVRLFPDLEYTFKHALTHEVAYRGLLQDRRRDLHARITEAIERLAAERIAEQSERLAHHALRGELWEKAVAYLHQAGLRAMARGAHREAVFYLEQALATLRHLPETRQTSELAIDIRLETRSALFPLGDWARTGDHLQEAEVLARSLGDQHRLARIATFMVAQRRIAGDYDAALKCGQEALVIARTLGDRSIEVLATSTLGDAHLARGEFREAAKFLERNIGLEGKLRAERFGTPLIQSARSEFLLSNALANLGRFDEAIGHAEAAVRIAEENDHPSTLFFALLSVGAVHLWRGDFPRAVGVLERCLQLGSTWQFVDRTPDVTTTLGCAYALAGRTEESLALVACAVNEFRAGRGHFAPGFILLNAGRAYFVAGRLEEATNCAREVLALARRIGARDTEASALSLMAGIAVATGAENAEDYYREALALAKPRGMRPLVAHCHLGLSKFHHLRGHRDQAQEHLKIAISMYREMDMKYWLERASAAAGKLG
jgi:class 3 adenylate cyclase/tetratricopeptide (TPR) repeat protein